MGEITLNCIYNNMSLDVKFIIVSCNTPPILGLNDCLRFELLKRINSVDVLPENKNGIFKMYPEAFEGLGKLPGFCKIELTDDAQPVIQSQRKIPFSLHDQLKQTLDNLEKKNIVQKVDYPTEWVNSLIIVEKPNKSLRLCIDPKPLNKFICRSLVCRLTGKTVFSVIDMMDGFWQLQLDNSSADLCVFNTPFGRHRFNRVPFGISCAPEILQRKNYEIFGDISNVEISCDDIIISGVDEASHDHALKHVFERTIKNNIKFNFDKFLFRLHEVIFLGQK